MLRITLAYDGGRYVGWQRQATGTSIQSLVEHALEVIEGRPVAVVGAGRTDAGVHAMGQVASFALTHPIEPGALLRALNARLPEDVRVLEADEAPAGFNARFSAREKVYRYRILNCRVADPFEHRFSWHIPQTLDFEAMADALAVLEGRHDFAAFEAAGGSVRSTVRTLTGVSAQLSPWGRLGAPSVGPGGLVTIDLRGDGFLRHMVRNIVGSVVEVGRGRRPVQWMAEVLERGDRRVAGPTAPPQGLFLWSVSYPDSFSPSSR